MAVIKVPVSKLRRRARRGQDSEQQKGARGEARSNEVPRTDGEQKGPSGEERSSEGDDICAFCDDGGDFVVCCDGGCLRSFHPKEEHGRPSKCTTLGLTEEQWQIVDNMDIWICENCKYKQYQCFACGLLGSSGLSTGSEVFQCKDQKCGHFYHPKCVAELFYPDSKTLSLQFEQHVAGGLEFHCPMHKCSSCKKAENKDDKTMQFAVCRRCPTAYHRKCLPRDISFEEDDDEGTPRRAWDGVLPDRILIYCMKHKIQQELGTPKRDHIVFPVARNLCAAKKPKSASKEQDILNKDKLADDSSSKPSHPPQTAETGHDRSFCPKPIDSFAPAHLFRRPQPGSCGWLDG